MMKFPEAYRARKGMLATEPGNPAGLFFVPTRPGKPPLKVIASNGQAALAVQVMQVLEIAAAGEVWEHVSVSLADRCPTWDEMCKVKALFWDDEDTVMQLHPPKSEWISNHPFCLHLWRPIGQEIPRPPSIMVGVQSAGELPL